MDLCSLDHAFIQAWAADRPLVVRVGPAERRAFEDAGYAVEPQSDGRFVVKWGGRCPWTVRESIRGV